MEFGCVCVYDRFYTRMDSYMEKEQSRIRPFPSLKYFGTIYPSDFVG